MIHRDNIQEWLLLYADNELSNSEREAVDSFLKENPDLKHELNLLKDLRFVPEKTSNADLLNSLYIPSLSQQDISAIISYADGEGSIDERENTKKKIAADSRNWRR